jgi:superoxide dismutase, Cu-Zn family
MRSAPLVLALWAAAAACERNEPGRTATSPTVDSAIASITGDPVRDTLARPGDTAYFRVARMRDGAGRELGTLRLVDHPGSIGVTGRLSGLPPGDRAIHIHETGRCDGPDFESAGDHWNPLGRSHGLENPAGPHLGDMPNVRVGENGIVDVNVNTAAGTLRGDGALMDADGAAVVLHAERDDHRTDPSGNAGDRIACGVITSG